MSKALSWICSTLLIASSMAAPQVLAQQKNRTASSQVSRLVHKTSSAPVQSTKATNHPNLRISRNGKNAFGPFRTAADVKTPYKIRKSVLPLSEAEMPDIIGMLVWNTAWLPAGLYHLPKNADESFTPTGVYFYGGFGGVLVGKTYYSSEMVMYPSGYTVSYIYGYNTETGERTYLCEEADVSTIPTTQCYDETEDKIYGVFYCNDFLTETYFGTIDYSSDYPETHYIAPVEWGKSVVDLSIAPDGQIYGAVNTGFNTEIVKVDKSTGDFTVIGTNDIILTNPSGGIIDPKTGIYYLTVNNDYEAFIATIDLNDGSASKLFDFPYDEEVIGLYIGAPDAANDAPAKVTDLEADFNNGSLTGIISFGVPATTFDETPAEGPVKYNIEANDEILASGETTYGSEVSVTVTVPESGSYTFKVYLSNEAGNGPAARVSGYIGNDAVKAPTDVTASYVNGSMTISWNAPDGGVNGGYVDPEAVTYTVSLTEPEKEVIISDTKETSVTFPMEEPLDLTTYKFDVTASFDGSTSDAVSSNPVVLGAITPPYFQDFEDPDAMRYMTVLDVNADGRTWTIVNGAARVMYNPSMAMDDWMLTAPLRLEAGKFYDISYHAWAQGESYPERLEVKIGNSVEPGTWTETLAEAAIINASGIHNSIKYLCKADGVYYIGFHGISDADQYGLFVDDIKVSAAISPEAPADPESITLIPANDGTATTTIEIIAPSSNIGGEALTSISKIDLFRDGDLIHSFTSVTPGATVSYTDTPEIGYHTYAAAAYNEYGESALTQASVFCGINYPGNVTNVRAIETDNIGEVTISWDPVTTDEDGNPIETKFITYNVYTTNGSSRELIAGSLHDTSFTTTVIGDGEQEFFQFAVFAKTSRGEGAGQYSPMIPVGTPSEGFFESFAGGKLAYPLSVSNEGGGDVLIYNDETFDEVQSQDGDNGYLGVRCNYMYQYADVFTAKIALADNDDQAISLWMYKQRPDDINTLEIAIRERTDEEYAVLTTFDISVAPETGEWYNFSASLAAYAGKVIQVRLRATSNLYAYTLVDNIRIGSLPAYDLGIKSITAPEEVQNDRDYNVAVTVVNYGMKTASDYTVNFLADGELIECIAGEELASGAVKVYEITRKFGPIDEKAVSYTAEIIWDKDADTGNNISETVSVTPVANALPVITDLTGSTDNGMVNLSWSEPNIEGGYATSKTESFEDGESFAQEFKDWTFVDGDGAVVGGINNIEIPGIVSGETTVSFFVFDAPMEQFGANLTAHNGDKYLAALFRADDGTTDDWAISPVLSGNAQTISFYARSCSSSYPEKIEMCYSNGSLNPDDFVLVESVDPVPASWTLYTFDVPAGATHFAIRSCATGSFLLMLDDVTFESADSVEPLSIIGYNIFCDGEQINDQPVEECEYAALFPADGKAHDYCVTTLYEQGQSGASNVVTIKSTGIDAAAADGISVKAETGRIIISGAEGTVVSVFAADGRTVYSAVADDVTVVEASAGVYVVNAGNNTFKVAVR